MLGFLDSCRQMSLVTGTPESDACRRNAFAKRSCGSTGQVSYASLSSRTLLWIQDMYPIGLDTGELSIKYRRTFEEDKGLLKGTVKTIRVIKTLKSNRSSETSHTRWQRQFKCYHNLDGLQCCHIGRQAANTEHHSNGASGGFNCTAGFELVGDGLNDWQVLNVLAHLGLLGELRRLKEPHKSQPDISNLQMSQ